MSVSAQGRDGHSKEAVEGGLLKRLFGRWQVRGCQKGALKSSRTGSDSKIAVETPRLEGQQEVWFPEPKRPLAGGGGHPTEAVAALVEGCRGEIL